MFSVIKKRRIFYFYKRCILPLRANDNIKKYERREDYKFDDSFSAATSTARLAFVGREFFTCSSLSLRQSSFCFRVLSCSVRISEASGEWCSCSTKRLTRRLVTLFEASYSEDEVTTGSVNPRSHAHRATKEVALYFMVSDSWYENLINRALEWLK